MLLYNEVTHFPLVINEYLTGSNTLFLIKHSIYLFIPVCTLASYLIQWNITFLFKI